MLLHGHDRDRYKYPVLVLDHREYRDVENPLEQLGRVHARHTTAESAVVCAAQASVSPAIDGRAGQDWLATRSSR